MSAKFAGEMSIPAVDKDGKPVYATTYDRSATATSAVVDADGDGAEDDTVALIPVWNQKQAQNADKKYEYYYYASEDDKKNDVKTSYFHENQNETEYVIPATDATEEQKFTLTAVMVDDTASQKTAVKFDAEWNIVVEAAEGDDEATIEAKRKASRQNFVTVLWSVLDPLSLVLEMFLTGENLTIYDEITIRGFNGYEGVILPLINALAAPVFEKNDGTPYLEKYYATQEEFELAVYGGSGEDDLGMPVNYVGEKKVLLQSILDAVFALVDSLCDRPISTLATLLPYLSRFLESDGIDIILANLLSPVTAITDMIKDVFDLDIMGLIKGLLQGLASDMKDKAAQTAAEYAEQQIDDAAQANADAGLALAAEDDDILNDDSGIDTSKLTFMDIIWDIIEAVQIDMGDGKKLILSDIISDRLFVTLASCAWYNDEGLKTDDGKDYVMIKDIDYADGEGENINDSKVVNTQKITDYYVDRETVLLAVLDTLLFQESVRDLIGGLIGDMDFSDEALKKLKKDETKVLDTDYLLPVLLYGVFMDGEAVERLLIDLLSWYDVEYAPERVEVPAGLDETLPDWTAPLNEAELEKLPEQLDNLVAAILPLLGELLPTFGVNLELNLQGDTLEEMVENLIGSLFVDTVDEESGETKNGLATTLFTLLVNLFAACKLVNH